MALEVKYRVLDTLTLKGAIVLNKVASKKKDSDKYCRYLMNALGNFFIHRSKLYKNSKKADLRTAMNSNSEGESEYSRSTNNQ